MKTFCRLHSMRKNCREYRHNKRYCLSCPHNTKKDSESNVKDIEDAKQLLQADVTNPICEKCGSNLK